MDLHDPNSYRVSNEGHQPCFGKIGVPTQQTSQKKQEPVRYNSTAGLSAEGIEEIVCRIEEILGEPESAP